MKEGWEYLKLGDVVTIRRGLTYSKSDEVDLSDKRVLRSNNVDLDTHQFNLQEIKYLNNHFDIPQEKYLKNGELLMCMSNGSKIHLGKIAIYNGEDNKYAFGGFMAAIAHNEDIIGQFLYYLLISPDFKKYIQSLSDGANINNLKIKDIEEFLIPIPPLSEQQQIVEYLDAQFKRIDALKANAEQQLQAAKDLFQSALKDLMTPKEGWVEKKLGEMYDVRDGTHDSPKYFEHGFPLVTSKNLKGGYIDIENVKRISKQDYDKINERSKVDVGDVLFAMIGTIGNATLVEEEPEYAIKNMALLKVPNNQSSKFLKYLLDSKSVLDEMHKKAKGTTQTFVSLGFLRNFTIYAPTNKSEQEELVERIDNLSNKIKALQSNYEQTITLSNDLKQSLLKKIFE